MKKTSEERDLEELIRKQAEYAQKLQGILTDNRDYEKFVQDGGKDFLERRVFSAVEARTLATLKAPEFDPTNASQVAQLKAWAQAADMIRNLIDAGVQEIADARAKLNDLERSTREAGEP